MIYRHAKAAGLALSSPLDGPGLAVAASHADVPQFGHHTTPRRLLDAITLFASMTEEEKEALASTMSRRTFRKGEILAEQGDVLN